MKENINTIEDFQRAYVNILNYINSTKEIPDKIEKQQMKEFYLNTIGMESGPPITELLKFIQNNLLKKETKTRNQ